MQAPHKISTNRDDVSTVTIAPVRCFLVALLKEVPMRQEAGFTLIELMVVLVIIAILASIALPSYQNYLTRSRAQAAAADLAGLSAAVESNFQRTLSYHPDTRTGTAAVTTAFTQWAPAQSADFFSYNYTPGSPYVLKAIGQGAMAGCELTLNGANERTASAACAIGSSW